jgi:uncharacterized protein YfaS (alpha-2-macroglobulin family)
MSESKTTSSSSSKSGLWARMLIAGLAMLIGGIWVITQSDAKAKPMLSFKSGDNFSTDWKRVDSLEGQGLYQSALDLTNAIFSKAKKDDNAPQQVRALFYRFKLSAQFEENNQQKAISDLRAEIKTAKFPLRPVLQSILAELYWQYYEQHRWQFAQRSKTTNPTSEDIDTWDLSLLVEHTIEQYEASLQNLDSLQRTGREVFLPVLKPGEFSPSLRPTLYDFLAHRAIDFYSNEEVGLPRPAEQFVVDTAAYYGTAEAFTQLSIRSADTLSLKLHVMQHLQELTRFRLADKNNTDALIDVDLKRLELVNRTSVHPDKDSLFDIALAKLALFDPKSPISADVMYALARHHNGLGNTYENPTLEKYRQSKVRAHQICTETQKRYPETKGAQNCSVLKKEIERPSLSINAEKTIIPEKNSKVRIAWTNLRTLHFRIYTQSGDQLERDEYNNEKQRIENLLTQTPIQNWTQELPVDSDFHQHSVEMALPKLKTGFYVLLASPDNAFNAANGMIEVLDLCASSISYVSRTMKEGVQEYLVLDRDKGEPLSNVNAQLWTRKYVYTKRDYEYKKVGNYKTDASGFFSVPSPGNDGRQFLVEFTTANDRLFSDYTYQYRDYREERKMQQRTFFFTDRSIYRPGQPVYFKGILLESDGIKSNLLTGKALTVIFYDVNGQKVSTQDVKTNDFGSFNGSFITPSNGLTGNMHIETESGVAYFSVEEYKRPKFEVTTAPVKGSFRLNEKVEVTGTAKTYAGSVVDGASVAYRVVRSVNYPWWMSWRMSMPRGQETEITTGKVATNDTGGFVIPFTALPDRSAARESKPTFSYTVYIDVTDQSGETQSTTTNVQVGFVALTVTATVDEMVSQSDTLKIPVAVTNLMGTPESASVNMTIHKLEAPDRILRDPLWSKCDKKLYTEEEWRELFPEDPYGDEHLNQNWKKSTQVYTYSFQSEKEKQVLVREAQSWKPGVYVLEVTTKDKYGEEVKDIRYFTLFTESGKTPPDTQEQIWFMPLKTTVQPGQKAVVLIGTRLADVRLLYEVEHQGKIVQRKWMKLNNGQLRIEIPVEEKHRGNIAIHFMVVYNNRSWSQDQLIKVPWPDDQLVIKMATMRDKMQPGQPENWKLTMKGPTGDKVMAEMVASMYDASLDAFRGHRWDFIVWRPSFGLLDWSTSSLGAVQNSRSYRSEGWHTSGEYEFHTYDELNQFGFELGYEDMSIRGSYSIRRDRIMGMKVAKTEAPALGYSFSIEEVNFTYNWSGRADDITEKFSDSISPIKGNGEAFDRILGGTAPPHIRTNLNETAFFFPDLKTDTEGNVVLQFAAPEALTRWNFMAFAHTKTLQYGQYSFQIPTQKELMVMPNVPRFLRERDRITITAKIANLSGADMTGTAELQLVDALSQLPIDARFGNGKAKVIFTAKKGQSTVAAWNLNIPDGIEAVQYRIVASSGAFSDGEEAALPVLTNRMLVTETLPLPINGGQTKEFRFERLLSSGTESSTLRNHKLTLEFTSNPAWHAVQALPYLMEYPYECAEQTFSRYYANSIALHVANSSPKIKAVFESWKTKSPQVFLSNLEKSQELKAIVLEETPWVLEAKDESERKRRVGLLFDLNKMGNEQNRMLRQLREMQASNGGWPWFKGMPDDRYITQHIVTGMGHLDRMGIQQVRTDNSTWEMLQNAVRYLDDRIREDYTEILKQDKINKDKNHLGYLEIQYLYARSYFRDIEVDSRSKEAFDYFQNQAKQYWLPQSRYMQGMLALVLHRYEDKKMAAAIMKSLKETALINAELGMYWKENAGGWYWYQAPIETQALMIEAFDEVSADQKAVDAMRVWLLKNKQTTDWKTTKATAEACYALLLKGSSWLTTESDVQITVGDQVIDPKKSDIATEAGTGYFKTAWPGTVIKPEMGKVKLTKSGPGVSWGALYWQYFEQLDKITPAQSPLQIKKKLYRIRNTASGQILEPITANAPLQPGDKIKVKIELRNDRPMEYVHLKDMRASGMEPVNVLSGYRYQDGLGYYESTRDAATNFFIGYLSKGVHLFEYTLVAVHAGDFSNGITTAQCMYAPEFAAHSEGERVMIKR